MDTIGNRIKKYRTRRGWTQKQLAEECGWSTSRITNYESNSRKIDSHIAKIIASKLGVSPSLLLFGKEDILDVQYAGKIKNGLIIVCGEAVMINDGECKIDKDFNGFLKFYSNDDGAFALKIRGDSLFPRINSGEFIVLEPTTLPQAGDEVLIETKEGTHMIKKLEFYRNGIYRFSSINQNNLPLTLEEKEIESVIFLGAIVKSNNYMSQ